MDYFFEYFLAFTCIAISVCVVFSYFFNLISEFFDGGKINDFIKNLIEYEYRLIPYVIIVFLTIAVIYYHGFIKLLYLLPLYLYGIYKFIRSHL